MVGDVVAYAKTVDGGVMLVCRDPVIKSFLTSLDTVAVLIPKLNENYFIYFVLVISANLEYKIFKLKFFSFAY